VDDHTLPIQLQRSASKIKDLALILSITDLAYQVFTFCQASISSNRFATLFYSQPFNEMTKLNGGLSRLHSADEDAVSWLTNYGK